ncbi:MAG: DNA polymerase III subunit beta [Bryobacterales bacterium]|nr:DNA polymerase III subunit beta [Bryobacterales bacterium]
MEFTIRKQDLVRELSLSQGVVEKRSTIPVLSNVLLEARGAQVHLTATDLELGIRSACPAQVVREGAGTLPARRLLDYVRLLPDVEIHFRFQENQWAAIQCGRSRTKIAGMSRESFPELPEMPARLAEVPIGLLTGMISRTIFAISTEESRFTLSGALLVLKPSGAVMVATDGHRLAFVEAKAEIAAPATPARCLLPKKAMTELLRLGQEASPEQTVQFATDDNHLFFQIGNRMLISRKLSGSFPDYERVLPREANYVVVLERDEVRAAIERVSQFADERSHAMRVQLIPGEVRLYSAASDTGESEESLPADYQGENFEIGFNAGYILDFLRATSERQVQFNFRDPHSAAELRPVADGGAWQYRYVLMPMRI